MKNIYKQLGILNFKIRVFFRKLIIYFSELNKLHTNKSYKNIKWTKEEKNDFNLYWKQNYGKRISNKTHRLYQSINGKFDIEYIPDHIFSTKLEFIFNDYDYANVLSNKTFIPTLFSGIKGLYIPKIFYANIKGTIFFPDPNIEKIEDLPKEFVIKPAFGSSSGRNVRIIKCNPQNSELSKIIKKYNSNCLIQEKVIQHESLSVLHPNSLNTLRIITYNFNGKIYVAPISLRMGINNSEVDNAHAGGLVIGVDKSGKLKEYAYKLGYKFSTQKYDLHPTTKVKFDGHQIYNFNKVLDVAKEMHMRIFQFGFVSWDFSITENGLPAIIEVNLGGSSPWFPQIVNGESLFGTNTKNILISLSKGHVKMYK